MKIIQPESYTKGLVKIDWVELGEGFDGDYDEDDPDDVELLRFDVFVKGYAAANNFVTNEDRGDGWCMLASRCTYAPASMTHQERKFGLRLLMDKIYDRAREGVGVNQAVDEGSGIDLKQIKEYRARWGK